MFQLTLNTLPIGEGSHQVAVRFYETTRDPWDGYLLTCGRTLSVICEPTGAKPSERLVEILEAIREAL